jgi:glutathione S-transferase
VHVNTLENLIIFIPAVWIFATYVSVRWAAVLGFVFVAARVIYAVGYLKAAEKRSIGAGITGVVDIVLVVGGLIGLVQALA